MAKIQDCFKIDKDLLEEVRKASKAKGMSRATLYRMAIIEYLNKK
jgi:metal-responsive CopG/Arc/MetJ family transcriptional regulator